jgi:hypothetical protein
MTYSPIWKNCNLTYLQEIKPRNNSHSSMLPPLLHLLKNKNKKHRKNSEPLTFPIFLPHLTLGHHHPRGCPKPINRSSSCSVQAAYCSGLLKSITTHPTKCRVDHPHNKFKSGCLQAGWPTHDLYTRWLNKEETKARWISLAPWKSERNMEFVLCCLGGSFSVLGTELRLAKWPQFANQPQLPSRPYQ